MVNEIVVRLPNAMVGLYRIERQIGWWPLLSRRLTIRVYAAQETIRYLQAQYQMADENWFLRHRKEVHGGEHLVVITLRAVLALQIDFKISSGYAPVLCVRLDGFASPRDASDRAWNCVAADTSSWN
jgi:hypothetical protein